MLKQPCREGQPLHPFRGQKDIHANMDRTTPTRQVVGWAKCCPAINQPRFPYRPSTTLAPRDASCTTSSNSRGSGWILLAAN